MSTESTNDNTKKRLHSPHNRIRKSPTDRGEIGGWCARQKLLEHKSRTRDVIVRARELNQMADELLLLRCLYDSVTQNHAAQQADCIRLYEARK